MFDLILRNCTIADGGGGPLFTGDIGIRKDTIAEVGTLREAIAKTDIDASGRVASPGFIDIHSHADFAVPLEEQAMVLKPLVMQGITTFVGGNCGFSSSYIPRERRSEILAHLEALSGRPMDKSADWERPNEFFESMKKRGLLLNMGMLAGHGTLRLAASGLVTRLLTQSEQKRLESLVATAMEEGCLGLSTGLQYFPGLQSDVAELIGCARAVRRYGGVFTSHLRSYSHTLELALDEVFQVGKEAGVPVQVSHLYWQPYVRGLSGLMSTFFRAASFAYNRLHIPIPMERGLLAKLEYIDKRRREGIEIRFDMVPTTYGFTELFAFLPPYAMEGSKSEALARLSDREFRKRLLHDIEHVEPDWPHRDGATWSFNYIKMTGWGGLRVMAVGSDRNRWMEGKSFVEIGDALRIHPLDAICDLLIEESGQVLVFHNPTFPDDPLVFRALEGGFLHPLCTPVTDTILRPVGRPAAVFYDCFPRFIEFFVKKKKHLSLQEAVKKCTSLPAEALRIPKRGTIKKGYYADIVLFDPETIGSDSSFAHPDMHPRGIDYVFINGKTVVSSGRFNDKMLAGSVIRRA